MPRTVMRLFPFAALVLTLLLTGVQSSPARGPSPRVQDWSVADVVEDVAPSVVNVFTTRRVEMPEGPGFFFRDPLFRRFFGNPQGESPVPRERTQTSLGSGVVYSADGYILTNNHVVQQADEVRVGFYDGREVDAEIIGTDEASDLALLKVDVGGLQPVQWADSEALRVGDAVLAIGNPFGLGETVTRGIVSAKGRSLGMVNYEDFIQTDASINPGNSGGALVDLDGRVVGINTAILTRSGGSQGIGFAIPGYLVQRVIDSLLEHGRVVRGFLGVYPQQLTSELAQATGVDVTRGVIISEVIEDSPASEAGLQRGDVVVALDGEEVVSMPVFRTAIGHLEPGDRVELDILRDGEKRSIAVELGERPGNPTVAGTDEQPRDLDLGGFEVGELNARWAERLGLDPQTDGVVVTSVHPASPAQRAGLQPGDLLLEVGNREVSSPGEVRDAFREAMEADSSKPLLLLIERNGQTMYLALGPLDG